MYEILKRYFFFRMEGVLCIRSIAIHASAYVLDAG